MERFVVGFAFDHRGHVLLMEKTHPDWQKGCLNGVGGKVKENESPLEAMQREGIEETGLDLPWFFAGDLSGSNNDGSLFHCDVFFATDDRIHEFRQIEEEPLAIYSLPQVQARRHILNVPVLMQIYYQREPFFKTFHFQYGLK